MSRVLLDTKAFLWWTDDSAMLSATARRIIADPDTECLVSLATAWEMAVKAGLGQLVLPKPVQRFFPEQLSANRLTALPLDLRAIAAVETLPKHHRNPFDRLLIAQSLYSDLSVVSANELLDAYGITRIW